MKGIDEISEENRKELADFIEKIKEKKKLGFNQLAIKSQINVRALNEIIYGKSRKTNPFYLQRLAYALKIDYKELYKIVGYLADDDLDEITMLKEEIRELKKTVEQLKVKVREGEDNLLLAKSNNIHSSLIINGTNNVGHYKNGSLDDNLNESQIEEVRFFIDRFILKLKK